jgi:hypothetical protein
MCKLLCSTQQSRQPLTDSYLSDCECNNSTNNLSSGAAELALNPTPHTHAQCFLSSCLPLTLRLSKKYLAFMFAAWNVYLSKLWFLYLIQERTKSPIYVPSLNFWISLYNIIQAECVDVLHIQPTLLWITCCPEIFRLLKLWHGIIFAWPSTTAHKELGSWGWGWAKTPSYGSKHREFNPSAKHLFFSTCFHFCFSVLALSLTLTFTTLN